MQIATKLLIFACLPPLLVTMAVEAQAQPQPQAEIRSFSDLTDLLVRDKVNHQSKPENQMMLIPTARSPIQDIMAIRWVEKDGVLHFVQLMPIEISAERMAAVESTFARMNHAMAVPGLGINHDAAKPYFRMTVPISPRGGITQNEVRTFFSFTLRQAASLFPTVKAVIDGTLKPEDAIRHHAATRQQETIPPGQYSLQLADSKWVITFDAAGNVALRRDDEVVVQSTASFEGDQIIFIDRSGSLATKGPGKYQWSLADGQLKFRKTEDTSDGREKVLTSGTWRAVGTP